MFDSISRSYSLVRHSWSVLKKDKEIMVFPVISGVCSLMVGASFLIPIFMLDLVQQKDPENANSLLWYAFGFLFYLVSYFITIFFNVGVMHCAAIRMDGGNPTVKDGFKGAFSRLGAILVWAFISATVGMILRAIAERLGVVGRIVTGLLGLAWSLLTYFVVPVMIFEGIGAGKSIKRSADLFKKTWGEQVVGQGGMGIFFGLLSLLGLIPVVFAIWLATTGTVGTLVAILIGASAVVYWIALGVVSTALSGIFQVALYRYASTGNVPSAYPEELVARHWKLKG